MTLEFEEKPIWEYKTIWIAEHSYQEFAQLLQTKLEEAGAENWELVTITKDNMVIFKRPNVVRVPVDLAF